MFHASPPSLEQAHAKDHSLVVDSKSLSGFMNHQGWRNNELSLPVGKTRFLTAQLASGITLTRSDCNLRHDFHSTIEHQQPVTILGFGLQGGSNFRFGRSTAADSLIREGDVWLDRPEDAIMQRHTPAQAHSAMVALKFDDSRIEELLEELTGHSGVLRENTASATRLNANAPIAQMLVPLLDNPLQTATDRLIAEGTALTILAESISHTRPRYLSHGSILPAPEQRGLERAIELLTADLASTPDLTDLAKAAGMSHVRLNRCFKKVHGTTIFSWLRSYRLELAKTLLQQNRQSITDIAYFCGFSSSSHLSSCFRSRFGITPQEFRRSKIQERHQPPLLKSFIP